MHHYTTHTWLVLANDENTRQMWHDIVPRLACQQEFLMYALMACTALHMAYLNPDRLSELTTKARTYQDHAMPLFRAVVPSVESETCDAVFIFARLVTINAFALDERLFMDGEEEDKLPSWLFFICSGCRWLSFRAVLVLYDECSGVMEQLLLLKTQSNPLSYHLPPINPK